MLKEGDKPEEFSLKDSDGKTYKLTEFKGKKVILYFYPKDDTPGCTKEACSFRDIYSEISKKNAVIVGISGDSVESHKKFQDKFSLPFILFSDPDKKIIKQFGALKKKCMFGKSFLGIQRSTFVLDEKGIIIKVFPNVNVSEHSKEILEVL